MAILSSLFLKLCRNRAAKILGAVVASQIYLLHLMDVRNYLISATPVSAATSLTVPGNTNWKGKYFT